MNARKAAVIGGGVIVVVGGILALGPFFSTETTFELKMQAGVCQPSDPAKITAGWRNKVSWTVTNVDCPTQYVRLQDFQDQNGSAQRVVAPEPVDSNAIATGQAATFDATVVKFRLWPKTYKYSIYLKEGTGDFQRRRDPDIDVWP